MFSSNAFAKPNINMEYGKKQLCYDNLKSLIWKKIEPKRIYVSVVWCFSCSF